MNLKEINISVEVHCLRPDWAISHHNPKYKNVRYRLYVEEDLITERNWSWDNNIFLNENIWIATNKDTNTVTIEPVLYRPEQACFTLKNLQITNYPFKIDHNQDTSIQFTTINT